MCNLINTHTHTHTHTISIQNKKRGKNGNDKEYWGKKTPPKKLKINKNKTGHRQLLANCVCGCRSACIVRGTIERWAAALVKAKKAKTKQTQNKSNARKGQHEIRPEVTSSRHLSDNDERTSTSTLALGYHLLGPPRHFRVYYCMP